MDIRLSDIASRFFQDESGASMVEYGLALLVVIAVGTAAMTLLGGAVVTQISNTCTVFGISC
ncbi:MAG: Flp family type IVb pilin [Paracoccaceae bacterium]